MPPTSTSFLFGRLNILPAQTPPGDTDFLMQGLRGPSISRYDALWSFLDVQLLRDNDEPFIYGYLVKYRAQSSREVVEEIERHISTATVENAVEKKAQFILYPDSMIVAFNPIPPQIAVDVFRTRFVDLFHQAFHQFFIYCELQLIQERQEVLEAIMRYDRVVQVKIRLHPSNPHNTDLWKEVDEAIKSFGASEYDEQYKAPPNSAGLNLKQDGDVRPEIKKKVVMAGDGYGEASVKGYVNGRPMRASTKRNPVSVRVAREETATPAGLTSQLKDKLASIIGRLNGE
jgi:hypothetical protein